jgi:hypothetical protein
MRVSVVCNPETELGVFFNAKEDYVNVFATRSLYKILLSLLKCVLLCEVEPVEAMDRDYPGGHVNALATSSYA